MALFDVFDERGRPLTLADLGLRLRPRRARQADAGPDVVRATGEERWLLHKATPVFGCRRQLSMVVSVIEELTEVKRAELAQRLLAEAGHALSSSLD